MGKILRVVDTEKWIQHAKTKFVASENKLNYQKLANKLSGGEFNDTKFVYGNLHDMNDYRIFKNKDGKDFKFLYLFYEKNKMIYYYIIEMEGIKMKISKDNGDRYLNQLLEI